LDGTKKTETQSDDALDYVLFEEDSTGKFTPRCCLIDNESEVIEETHSGLLRDLFSLDYTVSG